MNKLILLISLVIFFSITSVSAVSLCYQETANVSTSCGGLSTGVYSTSSNYLIDGNYTSGATNANSLLYVNYSKPVNITSTSPIWQVKDYDGIFNLSLNSQCLNAYSNKFVLRMYYATGSPATKDYIFWDCYNSTGWVNLRQSADLPDIGSFNSSFEEGMYYYLSGYTINNITFNTSVYETSSQNFILNMTYDPYYYSIATATLYYNGTSYSTIKNQIGTNAIFTRSFDIPLVNSVGNKSFYWTIGLYNGTSYEYYNTSMYNQTITPLNLSSCPTPFTNKALNFTTYDSNNLLLNTTLEANFDYWLGSKSVFREFNYSSTGNASQYVFCLNATGNVNYDATVSYLASGYDRREYIVDNGIINNTQPQNIPLYLGATADTDVVTIIVKDQNYNPLSNALVSVQEWNIGTNTYSNIGMLTTNNNGEGIINLELYNTWYRAVVVYQDNIVEVTDVQKLSSTTWSITVSLTTDNPYELFDSISHGLTFDNSTNITTFTWLDNDNVVNQGCLIISESTSFGYSEISSECITSVSGTINYQLTENGTYQIVGKIYLTEDYNVSEVSDVLYERIGLPSMTEVVSPRARVLSYLFIGTLLAIGIVSGNPILTGFLLFLAIFISVKLGWMNAGEGFLWSIVSVIIVILMRQSKK